MIDIWASENRMRIKSDLGEHRIRPPTGDGIPLSRSAPRVICWRTPRSAGAGACLFNERTWRLIDGHARKGAIDPGTPVPVLVGSWSEDAEAKILATLDPVAALAAGDRSAYEALI